MFAPGGAGDDSDLPSGIQAPLWKFQDENELDNTDNNVEFNAEAG
jgi:hypothetical protein